MTPQELFAANHGLAFAVLHGLRRHLNMPPTEDESQVTLMSLWEAACRFDASRGVRFTTFAWRWIWGRLHEYHRRESRPRPSLVSDSLAWVQRLGTTIACLPDADLTAREEDEAAEAILSPLPDRLRKAVRLRVIEGRRLADVGSALGVSSERARQLLTKAMAKLREAV